MGLSLREEEVLRVFHRTEGWLVGLQLAALTLRAHKNPSTAVLRYSGSHRFLLEYVQEEILARQPLATQRFLLRTAVLTSLCADLCQALTGEPASQQMLEALERANLFVAPLDEERRWYRVHPLIREALLARLQAVEPERVPLLHSRAAAWYAGQQHDEEAIPHALTARAVLLFLQGDFPEAFPLAREALPLLPPEDRQWRGFCLTILGTEAHICGQRAAAWNLLQQALALYDVSDMLSGTQFAAAMLGEVALSTGELLQAIRFFRQVLSIATDKPDLARNVLTLETGASRTKNFEQLAWYGLAALAYEQNNLEEAQRYLHEALAKGQFLWIHVLTPGLLLQVRLLYAQGEAERASALLVELAAGMVRPEVKREVHLCQAWLALKMGDLEGVQHWEEGLAEANAPLSCVRGEEEALLRARLRIAEGQPVDALLLLEPLMQEARDAGRLYAELQILVLEALAWEARGNREQACQCLLQAVTRARRAGYQRLFLEEGQPMETLLKTLVSDLREKALVSYIYRLLRAFGSAPAVPSRGEEPPRGLSLLTPQEHRVLRLLAEGASNLDIANALVIQLSTARKHVSNILSKLGAENRTQAIARAREYTLL